MYGMRIRDLRIEKGISLSDLARLSGVSKSYLSIIERGEQKNPSISILMKVAKALNVNLKTILKPNAHDIDNNEQLLMDVFSEKSNGNLDQEIIQQLEELIELLKMKTN